MCVHHIQIRKFGTRELETGDSQHVESRRVVGIVDTALGVQPSPVEILRHVDEDDTAAWRKRQDVKCDIAVAAGLPQSDRCRCRAAEVCVSVTREYYCGVVSEIFKRARQRANDIAESACFRPRRSLGRD